MIRKIAAILFLFTLVLVPAARGTMDYVAEDIIQKAMGDLESLYAAEKWDNVIELSRELMKKTPADHPIRRRAVDLITLTLDKKNRQKLQASAEKAQQNKKKNSEMLVSEALVLLGEKKYPEALERFNRAATAFGGDAETHFMIGYIQQILNNNSAAYLAYKTCVGINSDHPRALFHLAELSFKLKRFNEAESFSRRITGIMTSKIKELRALGFEQKVAGLNDKAISTARKIVALKRNLAQTLYVLGILAERKQNWPEADQFFTACAQINPQPMAVHFHLGLVNFKLERLHSAQVSLEQCVFIGETMAREEAAKAKKLLDDGKSDEAVKTELKLKELNRRLAIARYCLAVCAWKRKDVDTAIESIEKSIRFNPEYTPARFAKAIIMGGLRDFQQGLHEIRQILQTAQPNSPEALKAIKLLKHLMDRSMEVVTGRIIKPQETVASFGTPVNKLLKDMPALGGRKSEEAWADVPVVFKEVQDALTRGNVPEAIRRLLHLRRLHPGFVQVHSVLGQCYFEQGRLEDAATAFKAALAIDPGDPESLSNLAYIYSLKGEFLDKALEMVNKAIKRMPGRAEFFHTRGWIYFRMGEVNKAITDIKKSISMKPDYILARYNLGLAYYLAGSFEEAVNAFDQVISVDSGHAKAKLFKAITLAKLKRVPESVTVLDELKKKLPATEVLSKVVGNLHDKLKTADERHTEIELPRIKHFAPIAKLLKKAREYRNYGLVSRAKEFYLECQRLNPDEFAPWFELGNMYAESGLSVPALRAWEEALKRKPNSYELLLNMGKMHFRISNRTKARDEFAKAESLNVNDPEPSYYLGLIAYEEQRFESAESHALQALRLKPKFFKAWALLAMARIKLGRLRQARDAYETIYERAPSDSNIRRHARKKLWELARMMAPNRAPSYADAEKKEDYLSKKARGGEDSESLKTPDSALIAKGKKEKRPSLTTEEKILILKKLESFDHYPEPPEAGLTPIRSEGQDKKWIQKRLESFKISKKFYPPPPKMMTSKYKYHEPPAPAREADKADEHLKKGVDAACRGFLVDAQTAFEKAREVSPKNLDALVSLGYIQTISGNFKDAFDAFSQAVTDHSEKPMPHLAMGNLYWLGGKGMEALEQWSMADKSVKLDPKFNALAGAEIAWKRLADTTPGDADAHSNLGIIYMFSSRPEKAVEEFKQVLNIDASKMENKFYQAAAHLMVWLKTKKAADKKAAKDLLMDLTMFSPPFPHSSALVGFIDSL